MISITIKEDSILALYRLLSLAASALAYARSHIFLFIISSILCIIIFTLIYLRFLHPLSQFPGPAFAPYTNGFWYHTILNGRGPQKNLSWHETWGLALIPQSLSDFLTSRTRSSLRHPPRATTLTQAPTGPIVRIAPNHLSFSSHAAQKIIYGFGTRTLPSMAKDPVFFTPEVDHSMNIINETDREEHSRMRRMLSFAFSVGNLLDNEDVLIRRTDEFVGRIGEMRSEDGRKGWNIVKMFNYVTFDIMGEMSFGDSFDARLKEQKEYRYHWADVIVNTTYMNDVMRAVCVIPGLFTFLEWWKTEHMKKTLYRHAEYATEHTEARLAYPTTRKDFTHHILTSKGPSPTTKEIASHFNVIMMAGAVTTATFLAGVTYHLGHNKSALSRLQAELRARFNSVESIESRELMNCEYLNAVVEEGLRIYPPAGAGHLSRIVPEGGLVIDGRWIPGSTRVSVHQWSVLRSPHNFHNPSSFIPERWIKDEPAGQRGDCLETSLPFSYGPRGCLGRNLAYLEMRMVLAKLFYVYDLTWFNSDEVDWERDSKGYTLWEKPDLRVLLSRHGSENVRVRRDSAVTGMESEGEGV